MWTKLFGVAVTAGAIALSGMGPAALAACNPGSPNCIRVTAPLLAAKQQVNQGNGNFNCDPGPGGMCSDDLPGSAARTSSTHVTVAGDTLSVRTRR
jgi:hypothetical protein